MTGNGREIVVWRPPVDSWLYEIENKEKTAEIVAVRSLLAENRVPYVDMNPHDYSTSDLSHVDWFDTPRRSEELATRIVDVLRPEGG